MIFIGNVVKKLEFFYLLFGRFFSEFIWIFETIRLSPCWNLSSPNFLENEQKLNQLVIFVMLIIFWWQKSNLKIQKVQFKIAICLVDFVYKTRLDKVRLTLRGLRKSEWLLRVSNGWKIHLNLNRSNSVMNQKKIWRFKKSKLKIQKVSLLSCLIGNRCNSIAETKNFFWKG